MRSDPKVAILYSTKFMRSQCVGGRVSARDITLLVAMAPRGSASGIGIGSAHYIARLLRLDSAVRSVPECGAPATARSPPRPPPPEILIFVHSYCTSNSTNQTSRKGSGRAGGARSSETRLMTSDVKHRFESCDVWSATLHEVEVCTCVPLDWPTRLNTI